MSMEIEKDGKSRKLYFKIGLPNYALFALIVAIRAFQPYAEQMSDWSVLSWAAMATPVMYPIYLFVAAKALYALTLLAIYAIDHCDAVWMKASSAFRKLKFGRSER